MNESPSSGHPPDFLAEVERLLKPMYAECFTDETRKVQSLLLVTSFVLILFAFGVMAVDSAASFQVPLLGLPITVITGMRGVLIVLCVYFLASFSTRAYAEWKLWRLHHQAPMLEFRELVTEIESSWLVHTNQANTTLRSIQDINEVNLRKITDDLKSSAASPLQKNRDELSKKYETLCNEIKSKRDVLNNGNAWNEINKLWNERDKTFHALMRLDARLSQEWAEGQKKTQAEDEPQDGRLTELQERYRSQTDAPELTILKAQLGYFRDAVRPVKKILRIRRWLEALFPISFGMVAIILGILVHKTG